MHPQCRSNFGGTSCVVNSKHMSYIAGNKSHDKFIKVTLFEASHERNCYLGYVVLFCWGINRAEVAGVRTLEEVALRNTKLSFFSFSLK